MSHYAKVLNGIVQQVIVAEEDFFNTFVDTSPGQWIQTSYNTRGGIHYDKNGNPDNGVALRGNFAGVGYIYDSQNDVFYPPRPLDINGISCNSWTISSPTWLWTPPTPKPTNTTNEPIFYGWDETTKTWIVLTIL
jgi:hypothetical protein